MPPGFLVHGSADKISKLIIAGTTAEQRTQIGLVIAQQAEAEDAIGGQTQPIAVGAKWF
jgi:hypothetical protein